MIDDVSNRDAFDAMVFDDLQRLNAKHSCSPFGVEASEIAFIRRLSSYTVAAALRRLRADGFVTYCDFSKTWTAERPFLTEWLRDRAREVRS